MSIPEHASDEYRLEGFTLKYNDSFYNEKCKSKIVEVIVFLETKANWTIVDNTLVLLANDLGVIIESVTRLELTDSVEFKLFVNRVFIKDKVSEFIECIKDARTKIGEVAAAIPQKKTKTADMMNTMQKDIPNELRKALLCFKKSSSRRRNKDT